MTQNNLVANEYNALNGNPIFGTRRGDIIEGTADSDIIIGRAGKDTLLGAAGEDVIFGGRGKDSIRGGDDNDLIRGGSGNDTLVGDKGADTVFGGRGNDLMIWNNGDGSDLLQGGRGYDTVQVNGSDDAGDDFSINSTGRRVGLQRNNLGLFALDIRKTEKLEVNGQGGDDIFSTAIASDGIIAQEFNGGHGTDTINLSELGQGVFVDLDANSFGVEGTPSESGFVRDVANFGSSEPGSQIDLTNIENIIGTHQDDVLFGNQESNEIFAGSGDDVVAGDGGVDTLLGGAGTDSFVFNGDPFNGVDVTADNRQVANLPDQLEDFAIADDLLVVDAHDFAIAGSVNFINGTVDELTGLAQNGTNNANVVVVQGGFANAGAAASAIAETGIAENTGLFVYHNVNLEINRLVYSENLGSSNADISILGNINSLTGEEALNALSDFSEGNFAFQNEIGV